MIGRLRVLVRGLMRRPPATDPAPAEASKLDAEYPRWIREFDTLSEADRLAIVSSYAGKAPALITVLVDPRHASDAELERTRDSIVAQLYPQIDLLVRPLDAWAVRKAKGVYLAAVRAGDVLPPHALAVMEHALTDQPALFAYSDEDEIDAHGVRRAPYFKCDWNPDLLLGQDYACRLALMRREAALQGLDAADGLPVPFEAALYDLVLRLAARGVGAHVPHVLHHRASGRAPTPGAEAAMAASAARRLAADGVAAEVRPLAAGGRRIVWPVPNPAPLVSLLVPTRDRVELLRTCVEGLRHETDYPNVEVLILDNDSVEPETLVYFDELSVDPRVRVVRAPGPFNFPHINNLGAARARGELIGLINNDLKVLEPGWLSEMVGQAMRPEVGAVGALLYYGDDTVQHAGCVLGVGGVASHIYKGAPRGFAGHGGRMLAAQELSAVTAACLLSRREIWEQVAGFDETFAVAFNDIDYCLRVGDAGFRVLWTPFAQLYHLESASRGDDKGGERRVRLEAEKAKMVKRWGGRLSSDPFFSPNLSLSSTDSRLAFPPRRPRYWDRSPAELPA